MFDGGTIIVAERPSDNRGGWYRNVSVDLDYGKILGKHQLRRNNRK